MAYKMTGRITIRCGEKLVERLNDYADLHDKNPAELARNCIANWLDRRESEDRQIDALNNDLIERQAAKKQKRLLEAAEKRAKSA